MGAFGNGCAGDEWRQVEWTSADDDLMATNELAQCLRVAEFRAHGARAQGGNRRQSRFIVVGNADRIVAASMQQLRYRFADLAGAEKY